MNAQVATRGLSPLDQSIQRHLPAAARGDDRAFGHIVAACQNPVTAIALAIVRDVPASEDIAQEAFLSAWQNLKRLQNPSSFMPWLRQITRNLARDHLRARQRAPRQVADADAAIQSAIEAAADPQPNPFEHLLAVEQQQVANELISALPADSRETLLLFYREGQSSQQVADLLGMSDAAVRKRLSRARATVREELLLRFAAFAHDSAPSIAFTSVVATALSAASPPAAAAGILSIGMGTGAKAAGHVVAGAIGSIALGLVAALAGIFLGLRQQLRGAIDDVERQGLVRSAVVNALAALGFLVALLVLARLDRGWLLPVLATIGFMGIVFHQAMVVQPRVLARRHALEARLDPARAAARRRRERLVCWVGASVGLVCGGGGLLLGLISSGRL